MSNRSVTLFYRASRDICVTRHNPTQPRFSYKLAGAVKTTLTILPRRRRRRICTTAGVIWSNAWTDALNVLGWFRWRRYARANDRSPYSRSCLPTEDWDPGV